MKIRLFIRKASDPVLTGNDLAVIKPRPRGNIALAKAKLQVYNEEGLFWEDIDVVHEEHIDDE